MFREVFMFRHFEFESRDEPEGQPDSAPQKLGSSLVLTRVNYIWNSVNPRVDTRFDTRRSIRVELL